MLSLLFSILSAATPPASFAALFEPPAPLHLHYRARLVDGRGQVHRLEVWRQGDVHLRRNLDGKVEIFAQRMNDEVTLTVHDLERARVYTATEQEMLAMGRPMPWTDLAYALRLPASGGLTALRTQRARLLAAPTCQLYSTGRYSFCWSATLKLPLTVRDGRGRVVFQVEEASLEPRDSALYLPPVPGPAGD